jgi:hypothetical protein
MVDRKIGRRDYLYASAGIVILGLVGGGGYFLLNRGSPSTTKMLTVTHNSHLSNHSRSSSSSLLAETSLSTKKTLLDHEYDLKLDEFARNIIGGGPPKDGIPPIDNPKYLPVSEMEDLLDKDDVVFVVESSDPVKIFPQKILVWHEIVNDIINGEKASITYCPLAGSAIGYKGKIDDNETTLGTSGKLVNSNLVMYDRSTDSYWPQILGTAVIGDLKGESLDQFQVIWTRWSKAKRKYPNARVLSSDTGFPRSYGEDPYGSYLSKGNYYDSGKPMFQTMVTDNRLPAKEVVIGMKSEGSALAIVKNRLAEVKAVNLVLNNTPIVTFYDASLDTGRTYMREVNSNVLDFKYLNGKINAGGSEWTVLGEATQGLMKGTKLNMINSFDVMWFAWVSFYPKTEIYL